QSRGGVVDGAADQRLHRGIAAAGVNELDVKSVILEITISAGYFVWHSAQELAAIGEPNLPRLRRCMARRRWNYACSEACASEQRAPGEIGAGHARGRFIATAHSDLIDSLIFAMPQA